MAMFLLSHITSRIRGAAHIYNCSRGHYIIGYHTDYGMYTIVVVHVRLLKDVIVQSIVFLIGCSVVEQCSNNKGCAGVLVPYATTAKPHSRQIRHPAFCSARGMVGRNEPKQFISPLKKS
jgi:hypothetical protein